MSVDTSPKPAAGATPSTPSDPYVIYQLRKPSQRGTAVIPRFVPNTHAPAFSPANYRFARVWAPPTADPNAHPSGALLSIPRSFEYTASLGSDSSFWSDNTSSSWVSVSSLRTAQSDTRPPLLHANTSPVSAAAFFNQHLPSQKHSHLPAFRYPPVLSESLSEDALVDDLLSLPAPQFPALQSPSNPHRPPPHHKPHKPHHSPHPTPPPHRTALPSLSNTPRLLPPATSPRLPSLTRKRRSLWQWLFCTDVATGSVNAPSIEAAPQRPPSRKAPAAQKAAAAGNDRVPGGDRDFLHRAAKAPDAARRKRAPSFELRRGRPEREKAPRRSLSWNLLSNAVLGRDAKKNRSVPPSTKPPQQTQQQRKHASSPREKKRKMKERQKDRPRGIVLDEERGGSHHLRFQRSASGKASSSHMRRDGDKERERDSRKSRRTAEAAVRTERPQDRPREDRPREHRPRQTGQGQINESASAAPVQKSVVPSLREKKAGSQRMRSLESADPVTSRISSDLSSTVERSTASGASTPVSRLQFRADGHELDPALNGVASDVSSHASGGQGKNSPVEHKNEPEPTDEPAGFARAIDFDPADPGHAPQGTPFRSDLFPYSSPSTESGGGVGAGGTKEWEKQEVLYRELSDPHPKTAEEETPVLASLTDPVARALEKNRARSAGGPLSYLMKNHEMENDVDTQSTGLTSLADESVSTHKTVSGVEEYKAVPGYGGPSRYRYRDPMKTSCHFQEMPDDISDGSGPGRPVIFKSSGLFNPSGAKSPDGVSSSASPRRFHSDWSDPHATDIDVFCQCSCNCVYEEECRRTCELVYGHSSPSVSSSRSCSRPGYPGFQTLPPAIDSERRYHSPNGFQDSLESRPFMETRDVGGRTGFESRESSAQLSYKRVSAADEFSDPRSTAVEHATHHRYISGQTEVHMYDTKPRYEHQQESRARSSSSQSKRYRTDQPHDDRRREESGEGRSSRTDQRTRVVEQESRDSRPRTHRREGPMSSRRPDSSPRHRSSSRNEVNTNSREQRSRNSSRNTAGSGSSRQSSGVPTLQEVSRSGKKRDLSDGKTVERRRREPEGRKRYEHLSHADGTQLMGNSYVVKRNGPPPCNQTQMPQPYRASGYGREVSYDYEDDRDHSNARQGTREWPAGTYDTSLPVGLGPVPVVELEFETRRIGSSPDVRRSKANRSGDGQRDEGHGSPTGRQDRKGENEEQQSRQKSSSGNHHSKGEARPSAKQIKMTSRPSSRGSSRSRTPLFGIF